MLNVAILVHQQISLFELACATELFALPRPEYQDWYAADVVSFCKQPVGVSGGLQITMTQIASLLDYHTLIIPGWTTAVKTNDSPELIMLKQEVIRFAEAGKRIISLCSGAFLLAELGLLHAKKATTHWRYAQQFKQAYPGVDLCDDVLFTQAENLFCSAGSAAALDLGLAIIRQDFGYTVANQVAQRLVISPHRHGGQAQFVDMPMLKQHSRFASTIDWAVSQLSTGLNVEQLAKHAHMSRRSFDRYFRAALGCSPALWLNQQRIQLAKKLLTDETLSIEQVAEQVGYDNANTLRANFIRHIGVAPRHYQSHFNALT
ncbi:MAG: helix-turn-helix domain-containing protein [Paraglaciecola sp.]|nr:helix-turn-helix domain-containing protein [Paraglaciecola sp.]NCT49045.1 helix-turn-helix domain-containing protein [Paraglaciecola sp.]